MNATTEWSEELPKISGTYLVQYTADSFPRGDPNNIGHTTVTVIAGLGTVQILGTYGHFIEPRETIGWKWARVITAP